MARCCRSRRRARCRIFHRRRRWRYSRRSGDRRSAPQVSGVAVAPGVALASAGRFCGARAIHPRISVRQCHPAASDRRGQYQDCHPPAPAAAARFVFQEIMDPLPLRGLSSKSQKRRPADRPAAGPSLRLESRWHRQWLRLRSGRPCHPLRRRKLGPAHPAETVLRQILVVAIFATDKHGFRHIPQPMLPHLRNHEPNYFGHPVRPCSSDCSTQPSCCRCLPKRSKPAADVPARL